MRRSEACLWGSDSGRPRTPSVPNLDGLRWVLAGHQRRPKQGRRGDGMRGARASHRGRRRRSAILPPPAGVHDASHAADRRRRAARSFHAEVRRKGTPVVASMHGRAYPMVPWGRRSRPRGNGSTGTQERRFDCYPSTCLSPVRHLN